MPELTPEEREIGQPYIFDLRLTPAQYILVRDALQYQRANQSFDLTEIENRYHREMVRQALAVRRQALEELVHRMEDFLLNEVSAKENIPPMVAGASAEGDDHKKE